MPDLLIELLSEEIPARMQPRASADLKRLVTDGLVEAGLTYAAAQAFATPRRLTLAVEGLTAASKPTKEERKGPRTDAPEKALEGFLRSTDLTKDQLEARDDKKGQVWFAVIEKPGRPAAEIVAETLETAIRNFPWPKSMRWGAGDLRWVRPLHSILCLLTDETGASIVPVDIDGIRSGDTTRGHPVHAPGAFPVTGFDDYVAKLKAAKVVLDPAERAETIWHDATTLAFARGLEVVEDEGLLAEVAGLVEWPVTLMGAIGESFLGLPPEVLQTSMKEHQKFFSVRNPKTARIEGFVTVANTETADNGATILAGNLKVLSARLSDAKFFWENDLRTVKKPGGLETMAAPLANVTFHAKLGSQADRIARIADLADRIASEVGSDPMDAAKAARIAKADLASEMVYEFPELQGIMGRYYAKEAGLSDAIADAARDHYSPLGPSDAVPTAPISVAVALADKIDTLAGFWAIDEKPTGSKDPFALRRAGLGVIRNQAANRVRIGLTAILWEGIVSSLQARAKVPGELSYFVASDDEGEVWASFWHPDPNYHSKSADDPPDDIFDEEAFESFRELAEGGKLARTADTYFTDLTANPPELERSNGRPAFPRRLPSVAGFVGDLLAFLHDRLKVHLRDEGIRHDVIDACLAMPNNDDLTLLVARARALQSVVATEDGQNLIQGFKRANNILTQAEEADGVAYEFGADRKFMEAPEEKALIDALDAADEVIRPAMDAEDFAKAMQAMAALRAPIDAFFEAVQVNTDNQIVRRNRLNLLHRIRATCLAVADLTRLEG